ncbi:ABC transporter ATP-binding protein [Haloferax volcanii]|uniref:ABC transporter ATP-binding protein n=3 Tax=Haloferax volcanii TaxID=2246 RepID=A0A8T5C1G5_HALVO|nr:ABC transporter ATP-binding protein [Haloferax volcanii]ADE05043.1 ABC-type transport system ATP-binding protein (probable substrate sugar) [Haloferax volcanii DS2]ELY34547.1 putative sugar ABC transporter ATP-binding protein [Haloferax volcanii DS2]MBS8119879.1 ABC transporter ATP-binding protein [Haloferax volcanii]MBS8124917.1 ABC transporter ATP-binding protein [Haloferax volcanii]MBS8128414.1 ABC transporter ATP-binding protein [Haloferax volcanii]
MTDTTAPAVQLTDITKRFGDVVANDSVDLTLDRGSIHAVIGENGAGKTTLMNVLYGLYDPNEGTMAVDGEPRSFDSPRDAIAAGIGMIHQHFQLVDNMTVLQNIVLGHEPSTRGLVDEQAARRRITDICDTYGFSVDEHLDTPIEELGLGIQQHVEIVKSLYRGADTLILDEPTAVLTPQEVEGLFDVMEALTADGRSLIFITHKLDEAMHAADDITVLRDGSAVGTVDAAATSQNELARMMVGREVLFDVDSRGGTPGEVALTVDGVTVRDERGLEQVRDVSLSVREGEILGIAGVEGNGQQELIEAITGMRTPERGTVSLQGRDITELSRRRRIEDGVSYVPGDRLEEGLVQDYSLVRNALLSNQTMDAFSDGLFLDWQRIGDHADEIIEAYDVRPRNPEATAKSLSGGNQQKFIVGRELERDPSVLVAAHPTRGVDIGSIEFIHQRFQDMRAEGVAILLVSSKLDEVQKLSDRTAVMYEGSVVDTVDPDDVTEEELGLLMAGRARDGTERAARGAEGDA